ncbi:hypothetical protein CAC42_175 [Sphaceloma murrayae]|uniref:Uncharacterized protein n=1 Tax=Sphaceloma murrayae TaxID=2082308 RepID=A0A2K1QN61_9PEZI|nr:hypothetical protein CAC42_175 [Sphaceloma murrayae]
MSKSSPSPSPTRSRFKDRRCLIISIAIVSCLIVAATVALAVLLTQDRTGRDEVVAGRPIPTTLPPTIPPINNGSIGLRGPVITPHFPDPGLLNVNGTWWAYATRARGGAARRTYIQVASSPDFENWAVLQNSDGSQRDALPELPRWVNQTRYDTWAPSVIQLAPDSFIMYYAATTVADNSGRFHCIGYALSQDPSGPFEASQEALICPLEEGGAIDPFAYQDRDGQRWLAYKIDGNARGNGGTCGNTNEPIVPTPLMLQRMSPDGRRLVGDPIRLLDHNGIADDGLIEAPAIARSPEGVYFLFFSKGCFSTSAYTVSYATASTITGPYDRKPRPLFQTGDFGLTGPGGACVLFDGRHMVFHAFVGGVQGRSRSMYTALLNITGETVTV